MGNVVKERNIALCIVLSIITCGIYGIYWYIVMVDDLNYVSHTENDQSGIIVFLLGLITCGIYNWIWLYKAGQKVDSISNSGDHSVIFLILAICGLSIIDVCIIQDAINKNAGVSVVE